MRASGRAGDERACGASLTRGASSIAATVKQLLAGQLTAHVHGHLRRHARIQPARHVGHLLADLPLQGCHLRVGRHKAQAAKDVAAKRRQDVGAAPGRHHVAAPAKAAQRGQRAAQRRPRRAGGARQREGEGVSQRRRKGRDGDLLLDWHGAGIRRTL